MHYDSLYKTIPHGTLEDGQRCGQERNCWMDNNKEWMSLPMPELLIMASRKKDWKRISIEYVPHVPLTTWSVKGLNWTELPSRCSTAEKDLSFTARKLMSESYCCQRVKVRVVFIGTFSHGQCGLFPLRKGCSNADYKHIASCANVVAAVCVVFKTTSQCSFLLPHIYIIPETISQSLVECHCQVCIPCWQSQSVIADHHCHVFVLFQILLTNGLVRSKPVFTKATLTAILTVAIRYVPTHVQAHTCKQAHTHTYACVCAHTCTHTQSKHPHTPIHLHKNTHTPAHTHTHTHTYTHMHINVYTHACIYRHKHMHIDTHTHTHTPPPPPHSCNRHTHQYFVLLRLIYSQCCSVQQ